MAVRGIAAIKLPTTRTARPAVLPAYPTLVTVQTHKLKRSCNKGVSFSPLSASTPCFGTQGPPFTRNRSWPAAGPGRIRLNSTEYQGRRPVNFSYLSVAAILFLLSGMGAPAPAGGGQAGAAAWVGSLFELGGSNRRSHMALRSRSAARSFPTAGKLSRTPASKSGAPAPTIRARRKQYSTRFGFAEGAYLAIGPPAPRAFADLRLKA